MYYLTVLKSPHPARYTFKPKWTAANSMVINNDYEQGHLIFLFINFIIMKEQHKEQHNTGFFSNMELVFALLSGLALGIGYLLSINNETFMALAASILAYFFGGFFTLKEAIKTIAKGAFEI